MRPGRGQTLDLMDIVLRRQLTRPGLLEVSELLDAAQITCRQGMMAIVARIVRGEGRVGLVADPGLDADQILAAIDRLGRCILREQVAVGVEVGGLGHLERGERHQTIGTQQEMVLQRRLVDLGEEGILVGAIGACGVQVLGPLGERAVDPVAGRVIRRVRIIPRRLAASRKQDGGHAKQKTSSDIEPLE